MQLCSRAIRYLKTYGLKLFFRRLRDVAGDYAVGLFAPLSSLARKLPSQSVPSGPGLPEVFLLSGIEWDLRFQRPQQLSLAFARAGCRVHFCSPSSCASWGTGHRMRRLSGDGRVWQVRFLTPRRSTLNEFEANDPSSASLADSLRRLVELAGGASRALVIVEHPGWSGILGDLSGACIVYDCLDDFSGFEDAPPDVAARERKLVALSDAVVVTALGLADRHAVEKKPLRVIRNACGYDHFCSPPDRLFRVPQGKPVIGYHGAIEDWFDVSLVEDLARAFPQCTLLLVGGGNREVLEQLRRLPGAVLPGEVPYAELPRYVHAFTVGIVPFRIRPLTLGVNPVKVYEYLAAGLPVVSVPLPEMAQFGNLVRCDTGGGFVAEVGRALAEASADDAETRAKKAERQRFAKGQNWDERVASFVALRQSL